MAIKLATYQRDHSKLKDIAKANPGLRWQFRNMRKNGTAYWQTLPPNKVPAWNPEKIYRVKPGQEKGNAKPTLPPAIQEEPMLKAHDKLLAALDVMEKWLGMGLTESGFRAMRGYVRYDVSARKADEIINALQDALND